MSFISWKNLKKSLIFILKIMLVITSILLANEIYYVLFPFIIMPFNTFIDLIQINPRNIIKITIHNTYIEVITNNLGTLRTYINNLNPSYCVNLIRETAFNNNHINLSFHNPSILSIIFTQVIQFLIYYIQYRMIFGRPSGMEDPLSGQSNPVSNTTLVFKDVVGMNSVKKKLTHACNRIIFARKFSDAGIKMKNGIIMHGPPGNGKTFIAKALSNEMNMKFIYANASEFVRIYVGAGAMRVSNLFTEARQSNVPSIIFIDEFDAIGKRGNDRGGGNNEHHNTINQLLSELDGLVSKDDKILVIAATNRLNDIDPAILRPGRLGTKIHVDNPNSKERNMLIEFSLQSMNHFISSSTISSNILKSLSQGLSRASIRNIIQTSVIKKVDENKKSLILQTSDIFDAYFDNEIGEKNDYESKTEHILHTAYHEAGHAYMYYHHRKDLTDMFIATVESRERVLGFIGYTDKEEGENWNKHSLIARIRTALAGRLSEEIFTPDNITQGCSSDLQQARNIAEQYVRFGLDDNYGLSLGRLNPHHESERSKAIFDEAVERIIHKEHQYTKDIMLDPYVKSKIERFVKILMAQKTLYQKQIYDIFDGKILGSSLVEINTSSLLY